MKGTKEWGENTEFVSFNTVVLKLSTDPDFLDGLNRACWSPPPRVSDASGLAENYFLEHKAF